MHFMKLSSVHFPTVKTCFTMVQIRILLFLRVAFPPSPGSGAPSGHHQDDPGHSGSFQGQPASYQGSFQGQPASYQGQSGSYLQGQSGPSSISSRTKDVLTRSPLNLFTYPRFWLTLGFVISFILIYIKGRSVLLLGSPLGWGYLL